MKYLKRIVSGTLVLLGLGSLLFMGSASAQNKTPAPKGITVSPAFQRLSISPNQAEFPLEFRITNNRPTPQTITLSTADFNSLNETGGLLFVGSNPTALQKKYGLLAWLSLPEKQVSVPPGQTVTVKAAILNQSSLSGGGHYGALMLGLNSQESSANQPNRVAVKPIASSLLFVSKQGGEVYKMSLTDVLDNHSLFRLPSEVTLRFKNEGNTHLVPRGIVSLTDSSGKLIKKGIINEDSGIILPETARRLTLKLNPISLASTPGRYKLTVDYRYEGFDGFKSYQKSILLLTPFGLVLGLVILAVMGITIFYLYKKQHLKNSFLLLKKRIKK